MNDEIEKFSTSFLKIPNSFSEMTITSIQSFESSLFMIMLDRWPAALVHLSTAIETILKAHLSHRDNQHILSSINKEGYISEYTYFQLIELMSLKEELSTFIKSSSHEVRINRNKFIHGKLIPKDTPDALDFYDKLRVMNPDYKPTDYLFFNNYPNRSTAIRNVNRQFNYILNLADIKETSDGQFLTPYALRHYSLQTRLLKSKGKDNIFNLAKNAGTSVEQLERFYLKNLEMNDELVENLQTF